MDTIRMKTLYQLHTVVQHEVGTKIAAQSLYFPCHGFHFLVRRVLHSQLYPAASSLERNAGRLEVTDGFGVMGNELYLKHITPFCG